MQDGCEHEPAVRASTVGTTSDEQVRPLGSILKLDKRANKASYIMRLDFDMYQIYTCDVN